LVPVPGTNRPLASVLKISNNHPAAQGAFAFSNPLQKARFLRICIKAKTPLRGWLFAGLMWSWRESNPRPNMETICFLHAYSCLIFVACQLQDNLTYPYFLCFSPSDRKNHQASPVIACASLSGWIRALPPGRRPVPVPGTRMKPELLYSLRQRERNYIRQLLVCDTVQVTRHHTLHAYIPPLMLSKPGQPRMI
jgi:hypothetical protein